MANVKRLTNQWIFENEFENSDNEWIAQTQKAARDFVRSKRYDFDMMIAKELPKFLDQNIIID